MKIDAKYKPELCVSLDPYRSQIGCVELDVEKKRMCATNGHMLVVVPVKPEEHDKTGPVSTEAIKAARKILGNKGETVEFGANGEIKLPGGATFPRVVGGQFPPIDQVVPSYKQGSDGTLTIGLDAKYLLELAKALGADKTRPTVHLTIQLPTRDKAGVCSEVLDPYVVTVGPSELDGAFGVLMPCRVK